MHAIARVAIFRDERLVKEHPELAVQSRKNNAPWRENGKFVWTDSSNPKVQEYDIALAKAAATSGADEVQFDYVRFPAEGDHIDVDDARLGFPTAHAALNSQPHPAFVPAGSVEPELRIGREPSDEADAVHANNTVGL